MLALTTQRKILRKMCRELDIKYRLITRDIGKYVPREKQIGGETDADNGIIEIHARYIITPDNLRSFIVHEAMHIHAWRQRLWWQFHRTTPYEDRTVAELRTFLRIAWRAERWTDEQAKKWMAEHYPGHLYWFSYGRLPGRRLSKKWFDEIYLQDAREVLRKKLRRPKTRFVSPDKGTSGDG